MTKEDLLHGLWETESRTKRDIMVKRFFESNVCIPKGENRRPEADALHALIENGGTLTYKLSTSSCGFGLPDDAYDFSIKPSEPIYEYKWSVNEILIYTVTDQFYTDEEISKVVGFTFTKLIDTKQERK